MEVGTRYPRSAAQPLVALLRTEKRHVLDKMREALFILALVHGTHVHLEVRLESIPRHLVREDDVPEAVGESASVDVVVRRELLVEQRLSDGGLGGPRAS